MKHESGNAYEIEVNSSVFCVFLLNSFVTFKAFGTNFDRVMPIKGFGAEIQGKFGTSYFEEKSDAENSDSSLMAGVKSGVVEDHFPNQLALAGSGEDHGG